MGGCRRVGIQLYGGRYWRISLTLYVFGRKVVNKLVSCSIPPPSPIIYIVISITDILKGGGEGAWDKFVRERERERNGKM